MNIITITFDEVGKWSISSDTNLQQGNHLVDQLKFVFDASWGTITQVQVHALLPDEVTVTPNTVLTISSVGGDYWTYDVPSWFTVYSGQLKLAISCSYALVGGETPKRFSRVIPLQVDESVVSDGAFSIDPIVEDSILTSIADLTARLIVVENAYVSKTVLTPQEIVSSLEMPELILSGHSLAWSDLIGTAQLEMLNGVVQDIGLEVFKYGRASGTIADGSPAQFVKYQGQRPIFKTPVASEVNDNPHTVRVLATQSFTNNQDGYLTRFGNVRDIDTLGYLLPGEDANDETTWGDTRLWFDPVTNGLTRTRPSSPNAKISMGYVTKFHSTQGIIDVDVVVYPKLSELQDVMNGATDGQVWVYDSALGLTKPSSRLTDLEDQVLSIGGVENSAVDKVNDLLLDYADNVKLQGASIDIVSDTTSINIASYTDINIASYGDTDIQALQGVSIGASLGDIDISTGAGTITINADSDLSLNSNSAAGLYANGDLSLSSDQTINLYGASGIDLYSDGNITLGGLEVQVNGTLQVNGDIVQNGASYETHVEQIYTEKDHIILRDGAVAGLTAGTYAGLITKLADGVNDAFFGYNGDSIARVGDITYVGEVPDFSGTQALATRQDSPIANGVAYWNDTNKRFDTVSGLAVVNTNELIANYFRTNNGIVNNSLGANGSLVQTGSNGTLIQRNIADSNPALKVNLANASATGNIAEFQFGGTTLVNVNRFGNIGASGIYNYTLSDNAFITTTANGTVITRNRGDSNPALTVNEQQGTGDILRLQYGGSNRLVASYLGVINKILSSTDYLLENGTRLLSTFNYGNNGTVTTEGNNLFLGNAGNSTMGSTATVSVHSSYNIGIGNFNILSNTTGYQNNAIGVSALRSNTTGNQNNAIGVSALRSNTTGSSNIAIGYNAGRYLSDATTENQTGSNNTFVGTDTKAGATQGLSNSTALGYQAYFDASNQMVFGNASVSEFKFNRNPASIAKFGDIRLENTEPELHLIDTNNDSDYYIANSNGTFQIYDSTNDSARVSISSAGVISINGSVASLKVNTPYTELLSVSSAGTYTIADYSQFKFIELVVNLSDGTAIEATTTSGKVDVGSIFYNSSTDKSGIQALAFEPTINIVRFAECYFSSTTSATITISGGNIGYISIRGWNY